jgi:hypothetical protein
VSTLPTTFVAPVPVSPRSRGEESARLAGEAEPLARPHAKGGVAELLLVGGLTPILFAVSFLLRRTFGLDAADYAVGFTMFYGAYVINDPHFAVTYLLFYRDARGRAFGGAFVGWQRVRYLVAGGLVPLTLAGWALFALVARSATALGFLIQLMFLLVGWHYVKQGFGVMTVLAARRGVRFTRGERLAILAHCYAGWAYAWASPADAGTEVEEKGVVYVTLAHSRGLERLTLAVVLSTLLVLIAVLARKWWREGRLPLVTPLVALLCSIWAWSIYSSIDPLVRYVVPALHSVQYLYFVWLMRGNEAREREGPPWFEVSRAVRLGTLAVSAVGLGVVLFHAGPSVLDGGLVARGERLSAMGGTPYFAAVYAFVNVHHFFMDWVLWRRENPETRYLRG